MKCLKYPRFTPSGCKEIYIDYKNLIWGQVSIPFLKIIIQAAMGWNDRWILRVHYWSTHVYGSSQAPQDPGV